MSYLLYLSPPFANETRTLLLLLLLFAIQSITAVLKFRRHSSVGSFRRFRDSIIL